MLTGERYDDMPGYEAAATWERRLFETMNPRTDGPRDELAQAIAGISESVGKLSLENRNLTAENMFLKRLCQALQNR